MYCTKCGLEILDDAKFCGFCGEPTDPFPNRIIQPTQPTQPTQPILFQGTSDTPPRSSRKTGIIISVACTVFIVGILLLSFGTQMISAIPNTIISILVVGAIVILCIGCSVRSPGRHRRGSSGSDCSGCDCSGCGDCDCGGCDC